MKSKTILRLEKNKCSVEIKGCWVNGFFYASVDIITPLQGRGAPVNERSLDFKDEQEAINFYCKYRIKNIIRSYNEKHKKIILGEVEKYLKNNQPSLF